MIPFRLGSVRPLASPSQGDFEDRRRTGLLGPGLNPRSKSGLNNEVEWLASMYLAADLPLKMAVGSRVPSAIAPRPTYRRGTQKGDI